MVSLRHVICGLSKVYDEMVELVGSLVYRDMKLPSAPLVVMADLHGHADLFEWALQAAKDITRKLSATQVE